MPVERRKIAVLVDLPAGSQAGGHVKMWERLAHATAQSRLPVDLTVYFSGEPKTVAIASHVRAMHIPAIFSTARLKFLPYLPDHTDLARYHPQLAHHLASYDLVHTTDGFFAFARTAEREQPRRGYRLVHSFHTDQPAYAEIFTRRSLQAQLGNGWLYRALTQGLRLPQLAGWQMRQRLKQHLRRCHHVLAIRPEDKSAAIHALDETRVSRLRLGVDRAIFHPAPAQRANILERYGIPPDRMLVLFVGRLDVGKNIYPLLSALRNLQAQGHQPHLLTAGVGPAADDIAAQLGNYTTLCGFVGAEELAGLYAAADILAIPSEVEIGSLVLIEALACGLPVLVSNGSNLATLHGPTPAIQPVSSDGWEAALHTLLTEPEKLPAMRAAAQIYGQQKIADWNCILREDLYPAWERALAQPLASAV